MLILWKQKPFWLMVSSENSFTYYTDKHFQDRPCKFSVQIPCVNFHEGVYNFHIFTFTGSHCKSPASSAPSASETRIPLKHSQEGLSAEMGRTSPIWRSCIYFPCFSIAYFFFVGCWYFMTFKCAYEWLYLKKQEMWDIRKKKLYGDTKISFLYWVSFLHLYWPHLYYIVRSYFQRYTSTFSASFIIYLI